MTNVVDRSLLLQLVMDNIPQAIFWKDVNSRYLGCNKVFAKNAQLETVEEIVGMDDYQLPWLKEEAELYRETDKRVMTSGKAEIGFIEKLTNIKGELWLRTSKIPLYNSAKEVIGVLGTYEDFTPSIEMQLAIEKKNDELLKSNTRLEQINIDLERFSYAVSHDLQEPLRTVGAFIGVLKEDYLQDIDEKGQEYVNFVERGIDRMSKLIRSTLDYSRLSHPELNFEEVSLREMLDNKINDLQTVIKEKNAKITQQFWEDRLVCIPELMGIVFYNLILNSLRFNDKPNPEINLEFQKLSSSYLFSIEDKGIGIEEKQLERIFRPYVRLKAEEKFRGSGLGLSICKRIINIHQGKIWAASVPEVGTRISFEIPFLQGQKGKLVSA